MRILALNTAHDSSVCVINDGELEFFGKEERFSRYKRDKQPFKTLEIYKSLNKGEIDYLVYSSPTNNEPISENIFFTFLNKNFQIKNKQFNVYPHHLCHAMLAFTNSAFIESLVFVIDRDGSIIYDNDNKLARESESVYLFDKRKGIKPIHKSFWLYTPTESRHEVKKQIQKLYPDSYVEVNNAYSIVKVYEAATTLIGQNPLENGKTMGLSSYGENLNYEKLIVDGVALSHKFVSLNNSLSCFSEFEHLIESNINEDNYQLYANKAKQVQTQTQEAALNLIKKYVELTGIKNVCLVGGYALNVVANNYYIKNLPQVNFYFEPVADDTGITIGAAMCKHLTESNEYLQPLKNNFYHYYDNKEKCEFGRKATIGDICDLLIDQKSIAIFEGSPEAGPRALGHRSILFDPRNLNAKELVNKIKKREWYRPFAGVILESEFNNYFETLGLKQSPYMTINFDAKETTKKIVPGIVHVDGTCRIQTVKDGFLFKLLTKFYEETGCPMLLNTSFNLAGEALVQTKADALYTLQRSNLYAIYFADDKKLVLKQDLEI
jgi:carbamoyltransferase